ncbi:MAG: DUF885 family protein, partial [Gammaproteobacteria bacterium]|nr:DUF885 family protein [Gammaproteobacteria bacterium]
MLHRLALIMFTALALCGCSDNSDQKPADSVPDDAAPARDAQNWDEFVDAFIEDFFTAHPTFAVVNGRHEFDGLLPDWSQAGIAREVARLHSQRDRAGAFTDAQLTETQRAQREYLYAVTDRHLFWLETADWPARNPQFYFDWMMDSLDPSPYVTLDYAPAAQRMMALTRWLNAIPRAAEQITDNLRHPMPRTYLQFGIASFGGMAAYFEGDLQRAFADVGSAQAQARFGAAVQAASAAMRALAAYLEAGRDVANDEFALGPALFRQMIRTTERVNLSLDELETIGRADLRRNQQLLATACAAFA